MLSCSSLQSGYPSHSPLKIRGFCPKFRTLAAPIGCPLPRKGRESPGEPKGSPWFFVRFADLALAAR